jgi:NDP-sugar pyrophosphorylase family protein
LYQIEILKRAGITDITLSLSYQPDKIEQVLGDGSEYGVNLRFITEPHPMGTGGAYRFAADGIRETTLVFNGDILTDLHISKVIDFHKTKGAEATIVLTPVENPAAYGLVETGDDAQVVRFREKPSPEELATLSTNNINAGVYVLEPSILDLIPLGENFSFEYAVFPDILKREIPFYAYIMDNDYWRDIGTPISYWEAHQDFLNGRITGFDLEKNHVSDIATHANIDQSSVIGLDCVIKPNSHIVNSVLGPGVHVEEKAVVENSIVWAHTRIAGGAEVRNAIIGRSCFIGRNAIVGEGAVLGDKTSLTDYTRV